MAAVGPVVRALAAGPMLRGGGAAMGPVVLAGEDAVGAAFGAAARVGPAPGDVAVAPGAALGVATARGPAMAPLAPAVASPAFDREIGIGALQFRQGTLPPRLASARATSSPMATIVEQTLHRICIAPCGPLSRPSRLLPLNLPAQLQPSSATVRAKRLTRLYVHFTLRSCYCNRIGDVGVASRGRSASKRLQMLAILVSAGGRRGCRAV